MIRTGTGVATYIRFKWSMLCVPSVQTVFHLCYKKNSKGGSRISHGGGGGGGGQDAARLFLNG